MTVFCTLILKDGTKVGTVPLRGGWPPTGYTIPCNGVRYRVLEGDLDSPDPDAPIPRHVIDQATLKVTKVEKP